MKLPPIMRYVMHFDLIPAAFLFTGLIVGLVVKLFQ